MGLGSVGGLGGWRADVRRAWLRPALLIGAAVLLAASPAFAKAPVDVVPVYDTRPNFNDVGSTALEQLGSNAYFRIGRPDTAVIKTDGTSEGTREFCDYRASQPVSTSRTHLFIFGEDASGPSGDHLYASDGTCGGTKEILDFYSISTFTGLGDQVVFIDYDVFDSSITRLWASDGTQAGTKPIFERSEGRIDIEAASQGRIYFTWGPPGNGFVRDLWTTDGTRQGTRLLHRDDEFEPDSNVGAWGRTAVYLHNGFLWRVSDSGETLKLPLPKPMVGAVFAPFEGGIVFSEKGYNGGGVWTVRKRDGNWRFEKLFQADSADNRITGLTEVGGRLFFTAYSDETGRELYTSNGTRTGTRLVTDLNPGPASAIAFPQQQDLGGRAVIAPLREGRVVFRARDSEDDESSTLWMTDGRKENTRELPGSPSAVLGLSRALGQIFVRGGTSEYGFGLWKIREGRR